jgi:predicted dehydrogenase
MSTVRICQFGCGRWGQNILRDLLSLGCQVNVVDPAIQAQQFALAHGADHAFQEFVPSGLYDGYVVATTASAHFEVLSLLASAGKPVFCEKPIVTSLDDARRLTGMYKQNLFEMHKWRYHPGIQKMAQLVTSGELGDIELIRITRFGWGCPWDDISAPYALLPHDLSILVSLLGTVPPVKKMLCTNEKRPETGMIIQLHENGGPEVWMEYSTAIPEDKRSYTVVGSIATVQLTNSYSEDLIVQKGAPGSVSTEKLKIKADGPLPLLKELSVFIDHIQGGPPPLSPLPEAVQIIERLAEIGDWLAAEKRN